MKISRLLSIAIILVCVEACSGSNSLPSPMAALPQSISGTASTNQRIASSTVLAIAPTTTATPVPYRVHAFLEDTAGNFGCLFSGNYAAVSADADITSFGGSKFGKYPCPTSFNVGRHTAGFALYAYNDIVLVGNAMPISAISSNYYFENSSCSAPYVQPGGGSVNGQTGGREITNLADYPKQIAAQVNTYEASIGADYFFNDNFGNIGAQGIDTAAFCPTQWSVATYTAQFPTFLDALSKPQIVNLAGKYDDVYTNAVAASKVFMVAAEEGLVNFKKGAMFSIANTVLGLNRLLQLQAAGIRVAFIQYNPAALDSSGQPIEFPSGFDTMIDQRLWNYAGGWLVLEHHYFYMETANEGNFTNSGATVEPEYFLVPTSPLRWIAPGAAATLQVGNVLVREYQKCYYKRVLVGECAMVLNPNTTASSIPVLVQTYNHSVVLSGEGAMPALAGVDGGVSTPADTGTFSAAGPKLTSVPAGRAVILIQ